MARPKKQAQPSEKKVQTNAEELKELRFLADVREKEKEILYKELAILKDFINNSIYHLGKTDSAETLAEVSFRAGRAYDSLDKANTKLENMLEDLYIANDFEHYDEVIEDMNDQLLN